jgi:hypothetical protein
MPAQAAPLREGVKIRAMKRPASIPTIDLGSGALRTMGEAYHPEALDLRFVTSAE